MSHLPGCHSFIGRECSCADRPKHHDHGKITQGKPKLWTHFLREFPLAMEAVALHMEKGAQGEDRYPGAWKRVGDGYAVYSEALGRHLTSEAQVAGDEAQAIAVAANALMRLEHLLLGGKQ